jgi:hypothetical protein
MKVYRCSQGHFSTSVDCPFCLVIQKENEELLAVLVEGDGLEGEDKV